MDRSFHSSSCLSTYTKVLLPSSLVTNRQHCRACRIQRVCSLSSTEYTTCASVLINPNKCKGGISPLSLSLFLRGFTQSLESSVGLRCTERVPVAVLFLVCSTEPSSTWIYLYQLACGKLCVKTCSEGGTGQADNKEGGRVDPLFAIIIASPR